MIIVFDGPMAASWTSGLRTSNVKAIDELMDEELVTAQPRAPVRGAFLFALPESLLLYGCFTRRLHAALRGFVTS